jgi:hypothetical protein
MRVALLLVVLGACGGDDASGVADASPGPDAAGVGQVCGTSDVDLDAGAMPCAPGLVCCYPCGIPDCADVCMEPCTPGSGCQPSGCPGPFP